MMKLLVNQQLEAQGLGPTQVIGTLMDGIARHTPEGYEFQRVAATEGWRAAVERRDGPFAG
jgi:enoyl-CoA hydratase